MSIQSDFNAMSDSGMVSENQFGQKKRFIFLLLLTSCNQKMIYIETIMQILIQKQKGPVYGKFF